MKLLINFIQVFVLILLFAPIAYSQDDLLSLLEETEEPESNITPATFKGSRLINGHTIMTRKKGSLEFLIAHRFGRINTGPYEFFGIDNANVRFGLDYGLADWLTLGVGRNSFEKTYDGYAKAAVLRQQKGTQNIPVSITLFGSTAINTLKSSNPDIPLDFTDRISYTFQGLIARKFSQSISIQLMPTFIHFNTVESTRENDLIAMGIGGRVKITKRISINAEYYYRFSERELGLYYDPIAIGIDLETGGHVFQFQLTNSRSMIEKGFVRESTGNFFAGDIHLGFNITRTF